MNFESKENKNRSKKESSSNNKNILRKFMQTTGALLTMATLVACDSKTQEDTSTEDSPRKDRFERAEEKMDAMDREIEIVKNIAKQKGITVEDGEKINYTKKFGVLETIAFEGVLYKVTEEDLENYAETEGIVEEIIQSNDFESDINNNDTEAKTNPAINEF